MASFLFSIIIPTFNSESTLANALESIVGQSFDDYEVLIMDGHSTDGTFEVANSFSKANPAIKWFSKRDQGVYDAMNKGIERAHGQWLLFLGSDDRLYDSEVLMDVAQVISRVECDFIYGDAILTSNLSRYGGPYDVLKLHTYGNLCHQAAFYQKKLFDLLGNYNLKYKILADWDFNIRCFRHPGLVKHYIERDIVLFNNETGMSSKAFDEELYEEIAFKYIDKVKKLEAELADLRKSRLLIYGQKLKSWFKAK